MPRKRGWQDPDRKYDLKMTEVWALPYANQGHKKYKNSWARK